MDGGLAAGELDDAAGHRALVDLDIDVRLPSDPPEPTGPGHAALLTRLLPSLDARSRELAEATVLGGLLGDSSVLVIDDDAHRADPSLAFALARLSTDDFSPTPIPLNGASA